MKNEKGFTLVEMMVVLLVITVILVITIPNITKHNSTINNKGCLALLKMIEAQVQAYELDEGEPPKSMAELKNAGYIEDNQMSCPNGDEITMDLIMGETKSDEG